MTATIPSPKFQFGTKVAQTKPPQGEEASLRGEGGIAVDEAVAKKASIASFVGTAMEWYDFYLFSTASALVFASQFFTGAAHGWRS